jgi:hypothetical protein
LRSCITVHSCLDGQGKAGERKQFWNEAVTPLGANASDATSSLFGCVVRCVLRCSLLRPGRTEILKIEDGEAKKQDIDIEIFCALLDRDDCQYLRKTLPSSEFQVLQRRRIRLALRILRRVERNVDLLMEVGHLASLNSDPVRREQAEELVAGAIQLRLNLLRVRLCLFLRWFIPSWTVSLSAFTKRCEHLRRSLAWFRQHGWQQSN